MRSYRIVRIRLNPDASLIAVVSHDLANPDDWDVIAKFPDTAQGRIDAGRYIGEVQSRQELL